MTFDDDGPHVGAGALPRVHGAGGGSSKSGGGSASSAPDTLFSTATVRLVDLLGEGEIVGVRGGLKGVYLNDVPVQNADGSFNFKGLTAEFRVGTPDQPYMAGYPDVQTPNNVGIKVNQATPVTVSISDTDVDRVRVTIQVPSLFLAKSDGSVRANSVSYRIQARYSGGPWVNALGDQTITGKTTSGYFRSHEIALPINPSGASAPWQVQVVRLSPDTDDFNNSQAKFTNQSDLVFHSTTSIVDARFGYPHSALVGLTAQAASFGSSVPGRTYLVDGVLMPIPSNYDPVARTYAGVWDGTFKEGFSNNPAWALNLVLRNDRFGLGEFIDTAAIDKWSLYEIGRYCDVMVSDGKGGQEPRYVFNGAISTQQEAFELLQLIAQVFRGTVYWSSGTVTAAQDRPADPVLLVTEANALEGENGEVFAYASSGRRARHTVAIVAWNDPDNLYKQTIEVVEDAEGIARYGYNPTKIDLLGCTSRGQAHRTGLWTLFTELHQTQVLTYRAGLDHAVIRPGDVVAVQDPQIANLDLSGRLLAGSTATMLKLDRSVTLTSDAGYAVSVTLPDGTVQERAITSRAGTTDTVTLTSALSQVPDPAAVWLITGPVAPQLFRIVSIREEKPHIYAVSALQHEPGKYAAIDDGAAFEPSVVSEFPSIVLPPTNLSVRESQYTELGQPKQAMTLSWTAGQPFNSVAYYVTVIRPSGATVTSRTASQSIDFLDAEVGVWTFVVTAIGLNGKPSLPVQTTYTLAGWAGQAATTVTGLSVKGGGSTFSGRSCTLAWTNQIAATVPPYPVRNAVYVFDAATQVLVHREVLPAGVTEWTYDYFLNVNEGGPRRQFRVGVSAYSAADSEGAPSYLTVANPPPAAITPTLDATSEVLFVSLPSVTDPDFAGYLVWVSETAGINPLTAKPFEVTGSLFTFAGTPEKTYYVRAAAFDSFGKNPAELNVSAEQSKKLTNLLFDPSAPSIPGQPFVVGNVTEVSLDGTISARITVGWPTVSSTNLSYYDVLKAEGTNPPEAQYVGGNTTPGTQMAFGGLLPGRAYSFVVRSVSTNNVPSERSPVLTVTAAANLVPPGAPSLFRISESFEAANLSWTNPSNRDLLGVEVWGGTTNAIGSATLLGTAAYPAAGYRDPMAGASTRYYWIRAVNTSGTPSAFVGPIQATSLLLQAGQVAAGIIDETKVASSLAVNKIVTALPATKVTEQVTLTGVVYKWDTAAGRYVPLLQATDIAGKISAAQVDTINGDQIRGLVAAANLAGIEASKVTGQMRDWQIADLAAAKVSGTLTAANIDAARMLGQIVGTQVQDGAISTPKILAGAITTSKLAVVSTNLAYNPDLAQGLRGWGKYTYAADPAKVSIATDAQWAPSGFKAAYAVYSQTAANASGHIFGLQQYPVDTLGVPTGYYPVNGNITYEFSAYLSLHRCRGRIYVDFMDNAGNYVGTISTDLANGGSAGGDPLTYPRIKLITKSPATATRALVYFMGHTITGDNPYIFVSGFMFAATKEGATETSPYVAPGVTTIDGGNLIARTVSATRLTAYSITADEISANAIVARTIAAEAVTTAHMKAGTIDASVLTAGSIKAGLLAANSVQSDNITAGSVTASKLVLTDTSNSVLNGDFGGSAATGNFEGWTAIDGTISTAGDDDAGGRHRFASSARDGAWSNYISCNPGDEIYVSAMNNNQSAYSANLIVVFQTAGSEILEFQIVASRPANSGTWLRLEGRSRKAPSRAQRYRVLLQTDRTGTGNGTLCYWGKVQARRAGSAEMIVDGAISARTINAASVFGDQGIFNSLKAGLATFGGLGADQISAGAITAAKLGVGLSTGNLIWNSDQVLDGYYGHFGDTGTWDDRGRRNDFGIHGTKTVYMHATGKSPGSGSVCACDLQVPNADGAKDSMFAVQGGETYEFSAYISVHRCAAYFQVLFFTSDRQTQVGGGNGNSLTSNFASGAPTDAWRSRGIVVAPANAALAIVRLVAYGTGENDPYAFFSGMYLGKVPPGTTVYSAYAPQSRTVIAGGQISTGTLDAKAIRANSITSDQIQTGSILVDRLNADQLRARIVDTDGLQASRIVVGGDARLSSWASGTQINGGAIAANSITTQSLKIMSRPISIAGINFEMQVDANGYKTGVLTWTSGWLAYIDDAGNQTGVTINAGSFQTSFVETHIYWNKGWADLQATRASVDTIAFDRVLMASYTGSTGLLVVKGGTSIDGDRISTRSIKALQIAAGAIQAINIGANQVTADHIVGGSVQARHIAGTTIEGWNIKGETIDARCLTSGSIETRHLKVGTGGRNLISGSDFLGTPVAGVPTGWGYATSNGQGALWFGVNDLGPYNPSNLRSFRFSFGGSTNKHIADIYPGEPTLTGGEQRWPVVGGQRYEFSVYVSAHRCYAECYIQFLDRDGNYVGGGGSNRVTDWGAAWELNNWPRLTAWGNAPTNAAYARLIMRLGFTGQENPYTFWAAPYFGQAMPYQSEASPWSVGGSTVIDGGNIRTGSVTADRMNVGSLSAINANMGTITAGRAQSGDGKFVVDFNDRYLAIWD